MDADSHLYDTWDALVAAGEDIFKRCSVCGYASNELMPCLCGKCERYFHEACAPNKCEGCFWPICERGVERVDGEPHCPGCAVKVRRRMAEMEMETVQESDCGLLGEEAA